MLDKIIFVSAFTLTSSAIAQQLTPNPQIIIREISARQTEEMQKAIMCEIGRDDLQKQVEQLRAQIADLQKQEERREPR
jgi:uncharacterized protein YneF (UPF0154 family)